MILLTAILVSSVLAQLEPPPENTPLIVIPNKGERFYATCTYKNPEGTVWQMRLNEPGNNEAKIVNRADILDWEVEKPDAMQARFDKFHTNRGDVKVPGSVGWISKADYEFAQRARERAEELERQVHPAEDVTHAAADPGDGPVENEAAKPGFLTLWGPQLGLALGGLALIGIIAKLVIFGGGER